MGAQMDHRGPGLVDIDHSRGEWQGRSRPRSGLKAVLGGPPEKDSILFRPLKALGSQVEALANVFLREPPFKAIPGGVVFRGRRVVRKSSDLSWALRLGSRRAMRRRPRGPMAERAGRGQRFAPLGR